jgi:hypothetical protein
MSVEAAGELDAGLSTVTDACAAVEARRRMRLNEER